MPEPSYPLLTAHQLGAELHAARKAQGLSQAELGVRIGLSQSRVSYLELNPDQLSFEQLLAWCAVLRLELAIARRSGAAGSSASQTDW